MAHHIPENCRLVYIDVNYRENVIVSKFCTCSEVSVSNSVLEIFLNSDIFVAFEISGIHRPVFPSGPT